MTARQDRVVSVASPCDFPYLDDIPELTSEIPVNQPLTSSVQCALQRDFVTSRQDFLPYLNIPLLSSPTHVAFLWNPEPATILQFQFAAE